MASCWFDDPELLVGESGDCTSEEVSHRLLNFKDGGTGSTNVCTDHSGFEKSHHQSSHVNFFEQGLVAEHAVFGSTMHPDRVDAWQQCAERVKNPKP